MGVIPLEKAIALAAEKETDLVEVSPNTNPPVCRLMDYGKYLYRQSKIEQKHKKTQKKVEVKGIRLSLRTGDHDLEVKARKAQEFIKERNLVKVQLIFRGRENAHESIGRAKMVRFAEMLKESVKVEEAAKRQGNSLIMILAPLK